MSQLAAPSCHLTVTASASLPALPAGARGCAGTWLYMLPPPLWTSQAPKSPSPCHHTAGSLQHIQLQGHPCYQQGTLRALKEAVRHSRDGGKTCLLQIHGFWRHFKANFHSLGHSSEVQDPAGRRLSHSSALCLGKINRKESSSGTFLLLHEMDRCSPSQENCPTVI